MKKVKKTKKTLVPQSSKQVKKTIQSVLDNNMKQINLSESDIPFIKYFVSSLLQEQGEDKGEPIPTSTQGATPDNFTPEKNKQDFEKSFEDKPSSPENFEVDGISSEVTKQNIDQIKTWADKLDEFANFLNDPDKGTSLHRILADSDRPGSLLRGVTRKATDSITRIAGEIEKLKEVLNSFIITAPKKLRDSQNSSGPLG